MFQEHYQPHLIHSFKLVFPVNNALSFLGKPWTVILLVNWLNLEVVVEGLSQQDPLLFFVRSSLPYHHGNLNNLLNEIFLVAEFKEDVIFLWIDTLFEEIVEILLNAVGPAFSVVKHFKISDSEHFSILLIILDRLRNTRNRSTVLQNCPVVDVDEIFIRVSSAGPWKYELSFPWPILPQNVIWYSFINVSNDVCHGLAIVFHVLASCPQIRK